MVLAGCWKLEVRNGGCCGLYAKLPADRPGHTRGGGWALAAIETAS